MTAVLRLASAQYPIDFLQSWQAYEAKVTHWVEGAVAQDANFLMFPEYFSMELASLFDESVYHSLSEQLVAIQTLLEGFTELYSRLAGKHGLYIQSGTFPVQQTDGSYHNRAFLFRPDGSRDYQDKLMMTRFENEVWHISAGKEIRTIATDFGRIGISICYDSEFPAIARRQVEAGAGLILVPSCTDTLAGYHRVRIGCQARALENQCFVVQSPTVGKAEWSEAVDVNCGRAGFFTPVDRGYPEDGVLASGELNQPEWVVADLELSSLLKVRLEGQVFNHRDWPDQFRF